MSVFSKATSSFVRQMGGDRDGGLIHVSRLNDSHKLVPMAVVVKRKRSWHFQRPKYQPSDFTLSDLLLGDALDPDVTDTDFISYEETQGDSKSGSVKARADLVKVDVAGAGFSKLKLSFGKLQQQKVEVRRLLGDCNNRLVDMKHCLVQQLHKKKEVLAVLKETVLTTTPCAITETQKNKGSCWGALNLMGILGGTEISVEDSLSVEMDRDISLEIPARTVIAYSLIELEIEKDGNFKLCLQPHTFGGFETDSGTSSPSRDTIDHKGVGNGIDLSKIQPPERALLSALNSELQEQEKYLCLLAELPVRRGLLEMLLESLEDRNTLALQEEALADWCSRADALEFQPHSMNGPCRALLDLLVPALQSENGSPAECSPTPQLTAVHLLVSAMEALPDETLSLLALCSHEILQAIDELICQFRGSFQPLPSNSVPAILLEEEGKTWMLLEQLLRSSNVTLERASDGLRAETGSVKGDLPLVLCLTLRGLTSLCNGDN